MEYEAFMDQQMNVVFDKLAGMPQGVYDPVSYSFIDFFSNGLCTKHYANHGYGDIVSTAHVRSEGCGLSNDQQQTLNIMCVGFYQLGIRYYEKLMEEIKQIPNLGELSEAVGFVARRLGRPDYCPPAMEMLLEQNAPSKAAN